MFHKKVLSCKEVSRVPAFNKVNGKIVIIRKQEATVVFPPYLVDPSAELLGKGTWGLSKILTYSVHFGRRDENLFFWISDCD